MAGSSPPPGRRPCWATGRTAPPATGTGDFDFYELDRRPGRAGDQRSTPTPRRPTLDSMVVVWDAAGTPLALNDDDGQSFDSLLAFVAPADGDYYVSVAGFPQAFPDDPFDSGSGAGRRQRGRVRHHARGRRRRRRRRLLQLRPASRRRGRCLGDRRGDPAGALRAGRHRGHRLDPGRVLHLPGRLAAARRRQRGARARGRPLRPVRACASPTGPATTTPRWRSTGRGCSASPARSCRRCSSTSTAPGSTPPSSAVPASGRCRRCAASSAAGASAPTTRTR